MWRVHVNSDACTHERACADDHAVLACGGRWRFEVLADCVHQLVVYDVHGVLSCDVHEVRGLKNDQSDSEVLVVEHAWPLSS